MNKSIAELSKEIHENARAKGFWDKERNLGEMLMLIVSEVSEAMEADRENRYTETSISAINGWVHDKDFVPNFKRTVKNTFEDELADVCIRVFDLAYSKGFDLQAHIEAKMRYNGKREHMHGKKY